MVSNDVIWAVVWCNKHWICLIVVKAILQCLYCPDDDSKPLWVAHLVCVCDSYKFLLVSWNYWMPSDNYVPSSFLKLKYNACRCTTIMNYLIQVAYTWVHGEILILPADTPYKENYNFSKSVGLLQFSSFSSPAFIKFSY